MHHSGKPADCIVNASGLLACRLGGVEDATVIPARGQIVLVRNEATPMSTISGTEDVATDVSYLMQRASGGGTILGGTYEKGNWEANPDPNTAIRIMKRCVELNPTLTNGKGIEALDIVRHGVGLRPTRKDGVRLETDTSIFEDGTPVVHNYGHAGWGYQGSYINSDTSGEATHCIVPRRHISAAMADQQLANKAAAPAQPINLLLDIVNGRHKLSRAIPIALLIFDALLCILIILKVPYTEIDWVAYMEQIGQTVAGERDYSKIKGGTGPLVYPAAHVYTYTGLYYLTDEGTNVLFAQFLFAILYLATLAVVMACYWQAKVPPYIFPILVLSKRLHSIFVLRCFNDGVAALFF
ncbi:hypothetical protein BN1723_017774, partial [Verticillium longisporum]